MYNLSEIIDGKLDEIIEQCRRHGFAIEINR